VVADVLVAVGACGLICDCIIFARARFSASGGVQSARGDTERVVVNRNLLPTSILNTLTTIRTIGFFVSGIVVANALVWIGLGIQFKPETAVPLIVSISSLCAHAVTFSKRLQHYFKHETVNRLESFLGKTIDTASLHCEGQLGQHIAKLDALSKDPQGFENALAFLQEFADKASLKPSLQMLESLSRNMLNSATMLEFLTGISLTAKEFAQLGSRQTGIPPKNVCMYDASVPSAGKGFVLLDISGKDILSVYGSDGLEGMSNKSIWKEGRNGCFLRFDSQDVAPRARDQRSLLMSFGRNVAGGGEEKLRDARKNVIKDKSRMDFHNMASLKQHQLVRMHCWIKFSNVPRGEDELANCGFKWKGPGIIHPKVRNEWMPNLRSNVWAHVVTEFVVPESGEYKLMLILDTIKPFTTVRFCDLRFDVYSSANYRFQGELPEAAGEEKTTHGDEEYEEVEECFEEKVEYETDEEYDNGDADESSGSKVDETRSASASIKLKKTRKVKKMEDGDSHKDSQEKSH
jgi:hypothetical protein